MSALPNEVHFLLDGLAARVKNNRAVQADILLTF